MDNRVFDRCYDVLVNRCEALGLLLSDSVIDQLLSYIQLMHRWNRTYNLTAVRSIDSLVTRHIVDSLTVLPYFPKGKTVLDVGTGAGLPGLPIAIVRPDLQVSLLDSNGKKICFLRQVVSDLGVKNVKIEQQRVELFQPKVPYDIIIARAFSSLSNLLSSSKQLCATTGRIIAMKGMYPNAELDEIEPPYDIHEVTLPGEEDTKRHIVIIEMKGRHLDSLKKCELELLE